ncbi:MAG: ABC transporter permease subunit [Demequinaceae bacterium]|nr:ABC transporter permease subunit [Demequinaceae bacterium]
MSTALALTWATSSRSLTARIATALAAVVAPAFAIGGVALARSGAITGPSAVKFAPFATGTFAEASSLLLGQILTVVMVLAAGFVAAWLFGREWADKTIGSLFSLPVSRTSVAWAKVAIASAWVLACVTLAVGAATVAIGAADASHLDAGTWRALGLDWVAGTMMGLLGIPFGWLAIVTRGYLGALGGIIAVTAVSQILAGLGVGRWVPYVAPALWAGAGGDQASAGVGAVHLLWALAFAGLGAWATVRAFAHARLD